MFSLINGLPSPFSANSFPSLFRRHHRGLPVLVSEVSRRVRGLRLRRADQVLAISPLAILPSALAERRRRPDCKFSKLNTLPHLSPVLSFTGCLATAHPSCLEAKSGRVPDQPCLEL